MAGEVFPTTPTVTVKREPIKGPAPPMVVRIYARDGSPLDVFQIDAKEIVAGGEYSYEPPIISQPEPPQTETVPEASATESQPMPKHEPRRGAKGK